MGKRYTLLGMIAVLVLLMGAVLLWSMRERPVPAVQAAPLAESEADDPPTVLKLFSPYSSGSFPSHVLKVFCDSVYSMSDNALAVQLYEGGAFREERNNLQALESGTLEMCAVSCDCLPQLLPEAAPLFTMFRCSSREEAMALLEGGEAQELYRQMEDMGILRLGSFWNGFRWLWTTEPVSSAEDFSALRLGIPDVRMLQSGFQNLTDTLVVTNGESLSLSLQSGSINACEQDLTEVMQQGISQFTPYCLELNHTYSAISLLMTKSAWDALTPEEQSVLQSCVSHILNYAAEQYQLFLPLWKNKMSVYNHVEFCRLPADQQSEIERRMREQSLAYVEELLGAAQ